MKRQPRILFFIHDGYGLGHVRRLSRIARAVQGDAACMVVCGHRAAAWLVPEQCEYMHIPSLESLLPTSAGYWGRQPFVQMTRWEAIAFRKRILETTISAFDPDAIIVDYLPLSKANELKGVITRSRAKKIFIVRGVMDSPEDTRRDIFNADNQKVLEEHYAAILVASDQRICDVAKEYDLSDPLAQKLAYVGYVSEPVPEENIRHLRSQRGIPEDKTWVICSAGGGVLGERLIEECIRLSSLFTQFYFDIVVGPRSAKIIDPSTPKMAGERVRIYKETPDLPLLHASGDIIIYAGGYNSTVEALEGVGHLICAPVQIKPGDEQFMHAERLAKYCPLSIARNLSEIQPALAHTSRLMAANRRPKGREVLNFDGIPNARKIILSML